MEEKVIQSKQCKSCGTSFDITDKDMEFYDKISPIFSGKKYSIPLPTLCPDCRHQRRLSFRNESKLYKRKCDMTGKDIISIYSPDKPYKVYDQHIRWSDQWNPLDYGMDFDFSKSFMQQYELLNINCPRPCVMNQSSQNSDYTNHYVYNKNCYMCFDVGYNEDCQYISSFCIYNKNCGDCLAIQYCENSYECSDSKHDINCSYLYKCDNCYDSHFCYNCKDCTNCYGCRNLHHKQYHIFNVSYEKEEYLKKIQNLSFKNFKEFYDQYVVKNAIQKNLHILQCENSSGDDLENNKDVKSSFHVFGSEDCRYCYDCGDMKIAGDATEPYVGSGHYETHACNHDHKIMGCSKCFENHDIYYCQYCRNSSNLFGCFGLRNKEYCILNKQYSKADYEKLVPQIIDHMTKTGERGEFFSSSLSPFGYNETVAQEYFPLTKEEVLEKGFKRSDYEAPFPKTDAKDIIICEVSSKPFRLIPQEIEFYKKHNLPLPTKHPDVRHAERMKLRNPRKLRDRKCMKCGIDIKTSYAPERPEIVYCEACYNKEIYG